MPLLAGAAPFNELPFHAHPDLLVLCSAVHSGASSNQTTVGTLWNFPGANSTFWHRDYPDEWRLLTVITAMRDYPAEAGWLHVQQETHLGGAFHGVTSRTPPCCGQPPPATTFLRKGDTLIFTATTKHAVTPNPSGVDRGLFYTTYAVGGRRDTYNMPDGAPSLRSLLARLRAGTLTPSLNHARG
jgi:ectoine hydroxylase-related dioxygenase (phytanoyl-CoA dioxygenase family)